MNNKSPTTLLLRTSEQFRLKGSLGTLRGVGSLSYPWYLLRKSAKNMRMYHEFCSCRHSLTRAIPIDTLLFALEEDVKQSLPSGPLSSLYHEFLESLLV